MHSGTRDNALPRHGIARGQKNLADLFARGARLKGRTLMTITFPVSPERAGKGAAARALFTVAKKQVPEAVERNRIKRLMREAYRLEKSVQVPGTALDGRECSNDVLFIAFIYRGRKESVPSLQEFRVEFRRILQALARRPNRAEPTDDE